ncbi:MAG: GGDEF domain-containing protein [Gemmatimonadales bacterium]|nr:GGDEF domain-containing protein [Gemmatimonadales bacterium]
MLDTPPLTPEMQAAAAELLRQRRALAGLADVLAVMHAVPQCEQKVAELFSALLGAGDVVLLRSDGDRYQPATSTGPGMRSGPVHRATLDRLLPAGSPPTLPGESGLRTVATGDPALVIPLDATEERVGLVFAGLPTRGGGYGRAELDFIAQVARPVALAFQQALQLERLHSEATTDELTGLANRRALEDRLAAELARTGRHGTPTTLVMLDLDRFKAVNDTFGHAAGDRLLRAVADVLRTESRSLDLPGRLGGDEFMVVLPMTTAAESRSLVRRVQEGMRRIGREHPEFANVCSASIGVAEAPGHGTSSGTLLQSADRALYDAKAAGGASARYAGG